MGLCNSLQNLAFLLNPLKMVLSPCIRDADWLYPLAIGFSFPSREGYQVEHTVQEEIIPHCYSPLHSFSNWRHRGSQHTCGHYKSRTGSVTQLCWACECPTMRSDWSKVRQFAKRKSPAPIWLVCAKSFDVLQSKSQHMLVKHLTMLHLAYILIAVSSAPGLVRSYIMCYLAGSSKLSNPFPSNWQERGLGLRARNTVNFLQQRIAAGKAEWCEIPLTACNDFLSACNIPGHEYAGIVLIMLLAL